MEFLGKGFGNRHFVLKERHKVQQLIQVCWNIEDAKTKNREIKALVKAMDEFDLKEGLVITEDYEFEEKVNSKKIKFLPLWQWLLSNTNAENKVT